MRDPNSPRVFLSYSRKDSLDFARALQGRLAAEGLSLYRDLSDQEGGEDWWRQIEATIRAVEHVVLVLSPAAMQSPSVTLEWKLARQEARRVSPVSGPGTLDFSRLPRWMERAHRHDITIPESYARLVQVLKGPANVKRVPFMADALPEGFVPRPEQFEKLKRSLLDPRGDAVAITAALRGAGGYGKTALANALCHDDDIQDAFSDGILRVTLGEKPDDLSGRIADLIETLTGERPGFRTLDAAKVALADALDDRHCLLVIDDAWRTQDLSPFLHRGPKDQTARLVTTRDDSILPRGGTRIPVDAMTSSEALEMLARGMPSVAAAALHTRLAALAGTLGEWPLLLGLANGVIRARLGRGAGPGDALAYAEQSVKQRGLAKAFRADDPDSRRRTAWGTLEVSLEQLDAEERTRFAELAVFVEDAEIPVATAAGLWRQTAGLDPLDGEDLLGRLADLSLLWDLDLGRGILRLHDVVRALLHDRPAKGRLEELGRHLVSYFRHVSGGNFAELSDAYGIRYLIPHLVHAGEEGAARGLLADPAWLSNKLQRLGVQPLLADYAALPNETRTLALIRATLILAAPALGRHPSELTQQLLGRLAPDDAEGMDDFLARARRAVSPTSLVPFRPTWTAPGAEVRRLEGHTSGVNTVKVLPDGRRAISGGGDRTLRLWDLETGAELRRFEGHTNSVTSVTVLPDGRRALSGAADKTLRLWDLETGAELHRFEGHTGSVTSVTVLPDGRRALSAAEDFTLRLWDLEKGAVLRHFKGHRWTVTSVTVLPDGRRALSGAYDSTLRLWDLETGAELRCVERHTERVTTVAVLPDGRRALSGSLDETLRVWDLETGAELRRFEDHTLVVTALPDGRRALSGSGWTLRLWDLETGAELHRFEGHAGGVTSVTVLPDGRRALSGSADSTLRLWDLEAGAELHRPRGLTSSVTSVTVLPDGRRALSAARGATLRLWDLETGAELRRFEGHTHSVTSVTVLPNGRRALSGAYDSTMRLWDLETGAELRRFKGLISGGVTRVTVLPDGRRALSNSDRDACMYLWDLETGAQLRSFLVSYPNCATVLPDGRRAMVWNDNNPLAWLANTLRLWDLETGVEVRRFEGHRDYVTSVAVLPEGHRALSGARDRTLRLWDLEMGTELRRFEGHTSSIRSVTVLPDGRRALSQATEGAPRLWDLETGTELRRLDGHTRGVTMVTVLPDGRRALSGSLDQTLRLWDLDTGAELARLTFDASPTELAWSSEREVIVVRDSLGRLHVVEIVD
jgi:WD40 repeat protein